MRLQLIVFTSPGAPRWMKVSSKSAMFSLESHRSLFRMSRTVKCGSIIYSWIETLKSSFVTIAVTHGVKTNINKSILKE